MTSYTDMFGNGVAVSRPSFLSLTLVNTDAYEFEWPENSYNSNTVLPSYIKIVSSVSGGRIQLPDARAGTPGIQVVISNNSSYSVTVLRDAGATLNSLSAGQCFLYTLIDNTTQDGTWDYITMGTVVSVYDATQLAGYGLKAVAGSIVAAAEKVSVGASRTLQSSDRGKAFVWTGGAGTITTADLSASGAGFFCHIYNSGTGNLTISPGVGNTLNGGASSVTLAPNQSCFMVEYSTDWYSLYNNTATGTGFTAANIACPGSGTKTLSTAELSAQIQNLTGTLTANITLDYNSAVGLWFVTNDTTGAYTITLRANGSDTGLTIGSGATIIMKSDGVNMIYAVASGGTVTSVASGTGLTGGPITGAGTLSIADTAVAAGTYGSSTKSVQIVVNSKGQLTSASEFDLTSSLASTYAKLASPTFTGTPAAPNPSANDDSTQIATTAFVADVTRIFWGGTAGGTANALTITTSPSITIPTGSIIALKVGASPNTGAATIAANGGSALSVKLPDGSDPLAGDLPANETIEVIYNGTQYVLASWPKDGYKYIGKYSASNSSSPIIIPLPAGFTSFRLMGRKLACHTAASTLNFQLSQNNQSSWLNGASEYNYQNLFGFSTTASAANTSGTECVMSTGWNAGDTRSILDFLLNPSEVGLQATWTFTLGHISNTPQRLVIGMEGDVATPGRITDIKFYASSGNISGEISVVGIR